ncbi:hypothetical protein CEXT_281491 [Caerostris extrusa]|uniref:Uncharacterized protein n=1 Tax=Caerostris extrusa TaxID=172846 RepID=A0AAV4Y228_CAEEX|nr:hypothetical protein CEXT_281491 [Caerostris extrusa]
MSFHFGIDFFSRLKSQVPERMPSRGLTTNMHDWATKETRHSPNARRLTSRVVLKGHEMATKDEKADGKSETSDLYSLGNSSSQRNQIFPQIFTALSKLPNPWERTIRMDDQIPERHAMSSSLSGTALLIKFRSPENRTGGKHTPRFRWPLSADPLEQSTFEC